MQRIQVSVDAAWLSELLDLNAKATRQLEMAINILRPRPATFRQHSAGNVQTAREHIVQALALLIQATSPFRLDQPEVERLVGKLSREARQPTEE